MVDAETASPSGGSVCPRCGNEIPQENLNAGILACSCGWVDRGDLKRAERQTSRNIFNVMLKVAILLVPVMIYLAQWRGFGIEVTILRLGSALGMLSPESQHRLAEIYLMTDNVPLALNKFKEIVKHSPKDWNTYTKLADMQMDRKEYSDAAQTLSAYIKNGGEDKSAAIRLKLAQALGKAGQTDTAIEQFKQILAAEPNILQVTVTQAYVKLLIENGRWEDAKSVVHDFRAHGSNGKDYLGDELAQIEEHFGGSKQEAIKEATDTKESGSVEVIRPRTRKHVQEKKSDNDETVQSENGTSDEPPPPAPVDESTEGFPVQDPPSE